MKNIVVIIVSFLLLSACTTFPVENDIDMAFTVSLPGGSVQLSGNPINVVGTTTTTGKTNHFLLFYLVSTDNAVPYGPWTEAVPVTTNQGGGTASLDIHSLVDAEFNYTFSRVFDNTAQKVYARNQLAANFTVKVGERYIDTNGDRFETDFSDPEAVVASTTFKALKGGFSTAEYNILSEAGYNFYNLYMQDVHFLTRKGHNRTLPRDAWLKLWFTPGVESQVTISLLGYYQGGGSNTSQQHTFTASTANMYEINTNLDVWPDITETHDGKKLVSYMVTISNGNWYDYVYITLDYDYHEYVNYFQFANSLGGVDLQYCTGDLSELPETVGTTYTQPLPVSPVSTSATKISPRKSITRRFKCNTGILTLEERRQVIDFLSSQNVWWQTNRYVVNYVVDEALVPIIIKPGSFTIDQDTDDPQSIEFEFEIAHFDKY